MQMIRPKPPVGKVLSDSQVTQNFGYALFRPPLADELAVALPPMLHRGFETTLYSKQQLVEIISVLERVRGQPTYRIKRGRVVTKQKYDLTPTPLFNEK